MGCVFIIVNSLFIGMVIGSINTWNYIKKRYPDIYKQIKE